MSNPIEERRAHKRYVCPEDDGAIRIQILSSQPGDGGHSSVKVVDLSRGGLALISRLEFAVGNAIRVRLSSALTGALDLVCIVCNRQFLGEDAGYRYGAYFEYDSEPGDDSADVLLSQLDKELARLGAIESSVDG